MAETPNFNLPADFLHKLGQASGTQHPTEPEPPTLGTPNARTVQSLWLAKMFVAGMNILEASFSDNPDAAVEAGEMWDALTGNSFHAIDAVRAILLAHPGCIDAISAFTQSTTED
jgi:hypothetical protein